MIITSTNSNKKSIKKIILWSLLLTSLIAFLFVCFWVSGIISNVTLNKELLSSFNSPIAIYDNSGEKIVDSVTGAPYVKLKDLQPYTISSFVDIEDKDFYKHNGINYRRMAKAFFTNMFSGKIEQGASTISQQLIKNTHLSNEKTYERKIKEIALAIDLEKQYSKDEILEMYLNAIYFGNGCYGIESAANFYFDKKACQLNINESATLAGIIKSPEYYSPINNIDNITNRKNLILKQMLTQNDITASEYNKNVITPIDLNINYSSFSQNLTYYSSAINEASEILNIAPTMIASLGYKVYTYFDENINTLLESCSRTETNALHNSMIVDNNTYGVTAYSSSIPYGSLSIKRSPASTIKPFLVYAPACEYGIIQPFTIINDEKTTFDGTYAPKNIGDKYYGNVSAQDALAKSLNIPAVKILQEVGINNAKSFAKKLNITFSDKDNGLSLALGSMYNGITIKDLVSAYSPFVFRGAYNNISFIKKITDAQGNVIYERALENKQVMSEETSYLVGSMLKESTKTGTCKALKNFNFDIHAKSGTNGTDDDNKNTDSICIAQTTAHTVCIWYYSKNYEYDNLLDSATISGLSPTLRIKNIFEGIYKDFTPTNFKKTGNIEIIALDAVNYNLGDISLASPNAPNNYKLLVECNSKYKPTKESYNFSQLMTPILTYKQNDNFITISFCSMPSQQYELIIEEYNNNGTLTNYEVIEIKNQGNNVINKNINISNERNYRIYANSCFYENSNYTTSNIITLNNSE